MPKFNPLFALLLLFRLLNQLPDVGAEGCNEFVCGSVVSKCLLTQSCQCNLTDCFCCKDCLTCLGDLYTECCSCLDMCPKHKDTLSALATPRSQIGDFEGVPELFDTLTAEDNDEEWATIRMPMRAGMKGRHKFNFGAGGGKGDTMDRQAVQHKQPVKTVNCTVIYLNTCLSNNKCTQYCESMGASSYRWFHDGCCECISAECLNYGINESRCAECPENDDEEAENLLERDEADFGGEDDEAMLDYGEEERSYN